MTDTEPPPVTAGACERGPVIPLVEAGGKRFEECVVCGLTLPWDRNLHHWFGFVINCERKVDAAES